MKQIDKTVIINIILLRKVIARAGVGKYLFKRHIFLDSKHLNLQEKLLLERSNYGFNLEQKSDDFIF